MEVKVEECAEEKTNCVEMTDDMSFATACSMSHGDDVVSSTSDVVTCADCEGPSYCLLVAIRSLANFG